MAVGASNIAVPADIRRQARPRVDWFLFADLSGGKHCCGRGAGFRAGEGTRPSPSFRSSSCWPSERRCASQGLQCTCSGRWACITCSDSVSSCFRTRCFFRLPLVMNLARPIHGAGLALVVLAGRRHLADRTGSRCDRPRHPPLRLTLSASAAGRSRIVTYTGDSGAAAGRTRSLAPARRASCSSLAMPFIAWRACSMSATVRGSRLSVSHLRMNFISSA